MIDTGFSLFKTPSTTVRNMQVVLRGTICHGERGQTAVSIQEAGSHFRNLVLDLFIECHHVVRQLLIWLTLD